MIPVADHAFLELSILRTKHTHVLEYYIIKLCLLFCHILRLVSKQCCCDSVSAQALRAGVVGLQGKHTVSCTRYRHTLLQRDLLDGLDFPQTLGTIRLKFFFKYDRDKILSHYGFNLWFLISGVGERIFMYSSAL